MDKLRVVIDTDTTGLDSDAEILALCIVNVDTYDVLFHELFRPEYHTVWPEAEVVNGITPEAVKDAPFLYERLSDINEILLEAETVIGYNVLFEMTHLAYAKVRFNLNAEVIDVMKSVAPICGDKIVLRGGESKYMKLRAVADYFQIPMEQEHSSKGDCIMTAKIFNNIELLFPDSVVREI